MKHSKHSWWLLSGHREPGSGTSVNKRSLRKVKEGGRRRGCKEKEWCQRPWRVRNAVKAPMLTLFIHHIPPYTFCLSCPYKTLFWNRAHLLTEYLIKVCGLPIPLSRANKQTSVLKQNAINPFDLSIYAKFRHWVLVSLKRRKWWWSPKFLQCNLQ